MEDSFKDFVVEQLEPLSKTGELKTRAMFGAYGLYLGDKFFGIIHEGRLFLKTGEKSREKYIAKGMEPFRPNKKQTLKNYYEIPLDVLEDSEELTIWAGESLGAG
jgi:DNA transformation protein